MSGSTKPVIFSKAGFNTRRVKKSPFANSGGYKITSTTILACTLLIFGGLFLPYLYVIKMKDHPHDNVLDKKHLDLMTPKLFTSSIGGGEEGEHGNAFSQIGTHESKTLIDQVTATSNLRSQTDLMKEVQNQVIPAALLETVMKMEQKVETAVKSIIVHDTAVHADTAAPLGPLLHNGKKRLAYAITITKDGPFLDGAAILAYSIVQTSKFSNYVNSLVAFVHPNVTKSREGLKKLGYHVIEVPIPINVSAIKFEFLREKINKNGCCGASELIKLSSYRLIQYHRVIHLDADVILMNPISELFERNYSLIYTTDPNMATYKGEEKMPVQGGFIVLQPSIQDYNNIVDIEMTTIFAKGSGWNRSRIGWFWGGMTVQGVLPYYYNLITHPGRTQIVDRCFYNTMADVPECITPNKTLDVIKSAHFTVCQKPWNCERGYANHLCQKLHQLWYQMREKAEAFYKITVNHKPCPKGGNKWYQPMELANAHFDWESNLNFIPDDSPDRLNPLPVSRYISTQYD